MVSDLPKMQIQVYQSFGPEKKAYTLDGILRRETVSRNQLVVPKSLKPLIYKHLKKRAGGEVYTLVFANHFTKYAQAYATKEKCGRTAARKL